MTNIIWVKNLLKVISAMGFMLVSCSGYAENIEESDENQFNKKSHVYIGGDIGVGGMDTAAYNKQDAWGENFNEVTVNRGGAAYNVYLGYAFKASENFSIGPEVGYLKYADNTYVGKDTLDGSKAKETLTYSGSALELLANATYHFSNSFYGFAKAGVGLISQKFSVVDEGSDSRGYDVGAKANDKQHKLVPEVAIGIGWNLTEHVGFNFTVKKLFAGKANPQIDGQTLSQANKISSVTTASMGLRYAF